MAHSVLPFTVACASGEAPTSMHYSLLFDDMPNHRVLLRYQREQLPFGSGLVALAEPHPEIFRGNAEALHVEGTAG